MGKKFTEDDRFEAECQGCEEFTEVNDSGLCDECAAKLDRDLIRKREWEYSASAFLLDKEKLEPLRNKIIKNFGKELELIAEDAPEQKKSDAEKRKQKKLKRTKRRLSGTSK